MDVKNIVNFKDDYDKMLLKLKGLIVPNKHKMSKENPPHITLGYIFENDGVEEFLKSLVLPTAVLSHVRLSKAGSHGVCFPNEE